MRIDNVGTQGCSTGLDQGVSVLLAYMFSWISGLIFYFVERENRFVRFSAMQSIIFGALWVGLSLTLSVMSSISLVGVVFAVLGWLANLGFVALSVVLIVLGFKRKKLVLPFLGELAERWSEPSI